MKVIQAENRERLVVIAVFTLVIMVVSALLYRNLLFQLAAGLTAATYLIVLALEFFSRPDVLVMAREGMYWDHRLTLLRHRHLVPWDEMGDIAVDESLSDYMAKGSCVRMRLLTPGPIRILHQRDHVATSRLEAKTLNLDFSHLEMGWMEVIRLLEQYRDSPDARAELAPLADFSPKVAGIKFAERLPNADLLAPLELNPPLATRLLVRSGARIPFWVAMNLLGMLILTLCYAGMLNYVYRITYGLE